MMRRHLLIVFALVTLIPVVYAEESAPVNAKPKVLRTWPLHEHWLAYLSRTVDGKLACFLSAGSKDTAIGFSRRLPLPLVVVSTKNDQDAEGNDLTILIEDVIIGNYKAAPKRKIGDINVASAELKVLDFELLLSRVLVGGQLTVNTGAASFTEPLTGISSANYDFEACAKELAVLNSPRLGQ